MGAAASTGRLETCGLALFAIMFLWQLPHFLAIAVRRADEYTAAGFQVVPAQIGVQATRRYAIVTAAALVLVSLLLAPLGVAGGVYSVSSAILGAYFLSRTLKRIDLQPQPQPQAREHSPPSSASCTWARSVFLASLVYLTLLFAALGIDRLVA
jgi:protoheme IX farnesyltransferase